MTTNDIENFKDEVMEIIKDWMKGPGFKERKLTDTPTDDLQVVNKKYVDDNSGTSALTTIPYSVMPIDPSNADQTVGFAPANDTTAYAGQVIIPFAITANKFSVRFANSQASANIKYGLYTEDGQTQLFNATFDTTSTGGDPVTTTLSSISIPAGIYYIVYVSDQAVPTHQVACWATNNTTAATFEIYDNIPSEPVIEGNLTVSSTTLPTTFTPSLISAQHGVTAHFRLDN